MSRTYGQYFWKLLPPAFTTKVAGEFHKLVTAFGQPFDATKSILSIARQGFNPGSAAEEFLPLHAADRQLPRSIGMSIEAWRALLAGAFNLYQMGGLVSGLTQAIECIGCTDVVITEEREPLKHDGRIVRDGRFRYGEHRWASFTVTVTLPPEGDEATLLPIIWTEIRRWKRVGTLCSSVIVREV